MPSYCTLFCADNDPALALASLQELAQGRGTVTTDGTPEAWTKVTLAAPGASLTVNRQRFQEGGDEFSKMILGLYAYIKRIDTAAGGVKEEILGRVAGCRCALGIVAEPEFSEAAGHYDCIFGLGEALDALIWNGSGIVHPSGKTWLDSDGSSEMA